MTRPRKIGTAAELRRREAQARRIQHAVSPDAELERLNAKIGELLCELRQRDLTIAALRRQLDDVECEEDSGSLER